MNQTDNYSKELAHYFDMLRFSRQMTLEALTEDIVSLRQFRRYLKGEYQMPQNVFNQLATRLGFKPEHILLEFEAKKLEESKMMNNLHNSVTNKDFLLADKLIKSIDVDFIIEKNNLLIYKFSLFLLDYYKNLLPSEAFVGSIKELLNYDELVKKTILSSTEVILLTSMIPIPNFKEKENVISLLENYVKKQKTIVSGQNDRMILLCLYYLSDYYGTKSDFKAVIKFCNQAIELCLNLRYSYLLHDFYYYNALAHEAINEKALRDLNLFRCYNTLHSEGNQAKIKNYYRMIESDFKIDYNQFILQYIKEYIVTSTNH